MQDFIANAASPVLMPTEDPAGKIVFIVILAIVLIVAFVALVTLLAAVLRGVTKRGRVAVETNPGRTLIHGFVAWAVFGALAAWLYSQAYAERSLETEIVPGYFIAACLAVFIPMLVNLLGAPGLYTHIGRRIAAMRSREMSDLGCVIMGSCVAITAALFPIFGWFLVLPVLLAAEFGCGVRALIR